MTSTQPFFPIILGSTTSAYGMARSFFKAYGIKSLVVGHVQLSSLQHSRILQFEQIDNLNNEEKFIVTLKKISEQLQGKKLLLLTSSDEYVPLIIKNKKELSKLYTIPFVNEDLFNKIFVKENFYDMCEQYKFKYPSTAIVTFESYEVFKCPFDFPIVIKASHVEAYLECSFAGKQNVFIANNQLEMTSILTSVYSSNYKGTMIIQEYIPGDVSAMRVLNAYVGKDGKVKLMSLGNPILPKYSSEQSASYAAIITTYDQKLMDDVKVFLEDIQYTGLATFTLKLDSRDDEYKFLELHLNNGQNCSYVQGSGHNLMKYVTDDYILNIKQPTAYVHLEHLWTIVPKEVLLKEINNEQMKIKVKSLIRDGEWTNSLYYEKDMNVKRWVNLKLNDLKSHRKFKNKGLYSK